MCGCADMRMCKLRNCDGKVDVQMRGYADVQIELHLALWYLACGILKQVQDDGVGGRLVVGFPGLDAVLYGYGVFYLHSASG